MSLLQNFTIIQFIAGGSFGHVDEVEEKETKKRFALKKIYHSKVNLQKKEIDIMINVEHNNVVKYYNHWFSDDFTYIQMELCHCNLRELLQSKRDTFGRLNDQKMSPTEYFISWNLIQEMVEGLNYLHSIKPNPIIHRDLKPENILVAKGENGSFVKISDFGLSKYHLMSYHSVYVGTRKYMAPEVMEGHKYNTSADLFSMGVIILEVIGFETHTKSIEQWKDWFNEEKVKVYIDSPIKHEMESLWNVVFNLISEVYTKRFSCDQLRDEIWEVKPKSEENFFLDYPSITRTIKLKGTDMIKTIFEMKFGKKVTKESKLDKEHDGKVLDKIETPKSAINLVYDQRLEVKRCLAPKENLSNAYNLLNPIRGKFIIINNVEEPQQKSQNSGSRVLGLRNETIRFKDLFEKLYFTVEVIKGKNVRQLMDKLKYIREDLNSDDDEAFGLMAISYGRDEQILGFNACKAIRRINFGEISRDNAEAQQFMREDVIAIKDIIDIFSEANCPQLKFKPKLFFFNCCPNPNEPSYIPESYNLFGEKIRFAPKKSRNMDTFIIYSCSKGYRTFIDDVNGYSYYGQALSHTIAQYACEEPISSIMARAMRKLQDIYSQDEFTEELMGGFCLTEVISYAMNYQLYFNPGISE